MKKETKQISDKEIRQLVSERLKSLSSNIKISLGSRGDFSREEMVRHVEKGDDIGKKIIDIQLSYLQSLKKGILYNEK